jgi:hypothetical protein
MAVPLLATFSAGSAEAVVYCKAVGVPKGCVVRPAPVVVAPAPVVVAPAPVVVAPRVATPVVGPNPVVRRAGVPGTPTNRGGPVNRVGRR